MVKALKSMIFLAFVFSYLDHVAAGKKENTKKQKKSIYCGKKRIKIVKEIFEEKKRCRKKSDCSESSLSQSESVKVHLTENCELKRVTLSRGLYNSIEKKTIKIFNYYHDANYKDTKENKYTDAKNVKNAIYSLHTILRKEYGVKEKNLSKKEKIGKQDEKRREVRFIEARIKQVDETWNMEDFLNIRSSIENLAKKIYFQLQPNQIESIYLSAINGQLISSNYLNKETHPKSIDYLKKSLLFFEKMIEICKTIKKIDPTLDLRTQKAPIFLHKTADDIFYNMLIKKIDRYKNMLKKDPLDENAHHFLFEYSLIYNISSVYWNVSPTIKKKYSTNDLERFYTIDGDVSSNKEIIDKGAIIETPKIQDSTPIAECQIEGQFLQSLEVDAPKLLEGLNAYEATGPLS